MSDSLILLFFHIVVKHKCSEWHVLHLRKIMFIWKHNSMKKTNRAVFPYFLLWLSHMCIKAQILVIRSYEFKKNNNVILTEKTLQHHVLKPDF